MKKTKFITLLATFGILLLASTQNALADLLLPGESPRSRPLNPYQEEPKSFIELIEPQHIIIGVAVLAVVIISFVVLYKMRKK